MVHGYYLDRSSKKYTCPECGERSFVRFINSAGNMLPEHVGRCDREIKCGYFFHANRYFIENPDKAGTDEGGYYHSEPIITEYFEIPETAVNKFRDENKYEPICTVNLSVHLPESDSDYYGDRQITNYFVKYLVDHLNLAPEQIRDNMNRYNTYIELTTFRTITPAEQLRPLYGDNIIPYNDRFIYWKFRTIYLYQDMTGFFPTARAIAYTPDFHRIQDDSKLIHTDYQRKQPNRGIAWCMYGEHLLNQRNGREVIIVESEKTAFCLSMLYPDYVWLATGGLNNLSKNYAYIDQGARYHFIPDSGINIKGETCADIWIKRIPYTPYGVTDYEVIPFNRYCTIEQIDKGFDLFDLYITAPERVHEIIKTLT